MLIFGGVVNIGFNWHWKVLAIFHGLQDIIHGSMVLGAPQEHLTYGAEVQLV